MSREVKLILGYDEKKKHSVRYKEVSEAREWQAVTIYLPNELLAQLGGVSKTIDVTFSTREK